MQNISSVDTMSRVYLFLCTHEAYGFIRDNNNLPSSFTCMLIFVFTLIYHCCDEWECIYLWRWRGAEKSEIHCRAKQFLSSHPFDNKNSHFMLFMVPSTNMKNKILFLLDSMPLLLDTEIFYILRTFWLSISAYFFCPLSYMLKVFDGIPSTSRLLYSLPTTG